MKEKKMFLVLRYMLATLIVAMMLFIMAVSVKAEEQSVFSDPTMTCLSSEIARGAKVGLVTLEGEHWTMVFENGTDLFVPAESITITFSDSSIFRYGHYGDHVTADNLYSLVHIWANYPPPYFAVKRDDGSIIIITDLKTCQGWMVQQPTIIPTGWEDHPLSHCLNGAYRASDDFELGWRVSGGNIHVTFGDGETISLSGNFSAASAEDMIVAERYDGFVAINGDAEDGWCRFQALRR
jgi:hypothetical protein